MGRGIPLQASRSPVALRGRRGKGERAGADAEGAVPGMRAHLVGCPACAEDHEALHALLDAEG